MRKCVSSFRPAGFAVGAWDCAHVISCVPAESYMREEKTSLAHSGESIHAM